MEDNVVDIGLVKAEKIDKLIRLTNSDILMLVNKNPINSAFDKIQNALSLHGKPYYWTFKVWKKIVELAKQADEERVELAKKYCDKNDDGTVKMVEKTAENPEEQSLAFTGENIEIFKQAFEALLSYEHVFSITKIQIDSALLEKMNNQLITNTISLNDMLMAEKIFDFIE